MENLVAENHALSNEKKTNAEEFDSIKKWLENNYFFTQINLSEEAWKPILYFSLVWNVFESKACNFKADAESIKGSVERNQLDLDATKYQSLFCWFQERYYQNGKLDARFDDLFISKSTPHKISNRDMKDHLESILPKEGKIISTCDMVLGLLFITYRIRNNFFHGNKDINNLLSQTELFHKINQVLLTYTDDIHN